MGRFKLWGETKIVVFFVILLVSTGLYANVITKGFSSDDFMVIRRVGMDNDILINGFFRPLSDITISLTYHLFNLQPFYYIFFNLIVHVFCGLLLFCICKKINWVKDAKNTFAWLTVLLFITYPFHNESIVWIVGRGSGMATLFALASLLGVLYVSSYWKYPLVCFFYFVGLSAYESIFPLPMIVILLDRRNHPNINYLIKWAIAFSLTLAGHFIIRELLSSGIFGEYGATLYRLPVHVYVSNLFKIVGRLILPPMENSTMLVILFLFVLTAFVFCFYLLRKKEGFIASRRHLHMPVLFLLFSLIVPVTFSVSTKTSEGDRLLYFPSVFICMLGALLIIVLFKRSSIRLLIVSCLLLYNIYFLQLNNKNWKNASDITQLIIEKAKVLATGKKQIFMLNIPNELSGAFIFRNGFEDAMVLNGIQKDKIRSINLLTREQNASLPAIIFPIAKEEGLLIPPAILFYSHPGKSRLSDLNNSTIIPFDSATQEIWFWNKKDLVKFSPY